MEAIELLGISGREFSLATYAKTMTRSGDEQPPRTVSLRTAMRRWPDGYPGGDDE